LTNNTVIKLSEIGNKINIKHLNMLVRIEYWDNELSYTDVNKAYKSFNITINQFTSISFYNVTGSFKNHN